MTETEWKERAESQRPLLTNFILCWYPANRNIKPQLPITAPQAERMCAAIRADIANEMDNFLVPLQTQIDNAFESKDPCELYCLLEASWFDVPESTDCWNIEGFYEAVKLLEDPPEPDFSEEQPVNN